MFNSYRSYCAEMGVTHSDCRFGSVDNAPEAVLDQGHLTLNLPRRVILNYNACCIFAIPMPECDGSQACGPFSVLNLSFVLCNM